MAATPDTKIRKEKAASKTETTGHEWDGIAEFNNPLPKWWVYVFCLTVVWALGYWVVFPAIPLGDSYTPGVSGWHSRLALEDSLEKMRAFHAGKAEPIASKTVEEVYRDPDLRGYALAGGQQLFKENCAPCHQEGGTGAVGYPSLTDDEWLWGGTLIDIETSILHGIRWLQDPQTRQSQMPVFGDVLSPEEQRQAATYVQAMSRGQAASLPESDPGRTIYVQQCAVCHSADQISPISTGNKTLGAPPLSNRIWLNAGPGKDLPLEAIETQIRNPRHGVMPAWSGRLKPETDIKMLAVYVHSLGGGQ